MSRSGFVVAAIVGVLGAEGCAPTLDSTVRSLGFVSISPMSTLFSPGSVVRVMKADPLEAEVVCSRPQSLGPALTPSSSKSATTTASIKSSRSYTLNAAYVSKLTASAGPGVVKNITVNLTNASVLNITAADVFGHAAERDPACSAALASAQGKREKLALVMSALQADLVYTVEFNPKTTLDVQSQLQVVNGLATTLGLTGSSTDSSSITSAGLYVGVQIDPSLVSPTVTTAPAPHP